MEDQKTEEIMEETVSEEVRAEEMTEDTADTADTGQPEESPKEAQQAEEEKRSFFKKKKDKKDEQIEELTDRVKRTMAEFDNYRKRTDKEKAAMFEVGAKSVFEKLLPIVDNFERGLATLNEEQKQESFAVGMDKTYQLLLKMMEEMDVKPIEAVGNGFDPNLHNAVMHVDDEEAGESVVVEEFQKGYTYRDSVLRCSMVKVAN